MGCTVTLKEEAAFVEQFHGFVEAAKELGCEDDKEAFKAKLRKVAQHKLEPKCQAKRRIAIAGAAVIMAALAGCSGPKGDMSATFYDMFSQQVQCPGHRSHYRYSRVRNLQSSLVRGEKEGCSYRAKQPGLRAAKRVQPSYCHPA